MPHPMGEFNAEQLKLLYRVARTLLEEGEYGELLAKLLDATIEGLGADRGFVVVREEASQGRTFRATVSRNFKSEALTQAEEEVSSSISAAVAEQGRALLLGDALGSAQFGENPSVKRLGLRSLLCAPLVASQEAFALIYLENRDIANRFSEQHRQLLDEICRLAAPRLRTAVTIEHARRRDARWQDPRQSGWRCRAPLPAGRVGASSGSATSHPQRTPSPGKSSLRSPRLRKQ